MPASSQRVAGLYVDFDARTANFHKGVEEVTKTTARLNENFADVGRAAGGLRSQIGLLDNAIRGMHAMALTDMIRRLSDTKIVMAALPIAATAAGIAVLIGIVAEAAQKFAEWKEKQVELSRAMTDFDSGLNNNARSLKERFLEADQELDLLTKNYAGAFKDKLELINDQRFDALISQLKAVGTEVDDVLKKLAVAWYMPGATSKGPQDAWAAFQSQYGALLATGQSKAASDLLAGTLQSAQRILDIQKEMKDVYVHHFNPRTGEFAGSKIPQSILDENSRELSAAGIQPDDADIRSQQAIVDALKRLQAGNEWTDATTGKKGAAAAIQEANRAGKEQVSDAEKHLDDLKAIHEMSAADEADYWAKIAQYVKAGSDAYAEALDKAAKAMQPVMKSLAEENDKWKASNTSEGKMFTNSLGQQQGGTLKLTGEGGIISDLSKDTEAARGIEAMSKAQIEWLTNLNRGMEIQKQNASAFAQASLQMAVATGQLSKYDAAQVQARLHTVEYDDALETLQGRLAGLADSGLTAAELKAQAAAIENQIDILNGERAIQEATDQNAIDLTKLSGSISKTFGLYVQEATDTANQVSSLLMDAFQSVNSSLATSMMAHSYNKWEYERNIELSLSQSLRGLGAKGLNVAFQHAEGSILKSLGIGSGKKRDGSSAALALYVQAVGGTAGAAGAGTGVLGGLGLPDFSKLNTGPGIVGPGGLAGNINGIVAALGGSGTTGTAGTVTTKLTSGLLGWMNNSNFFGDLFGGRLFGSGSFFGGGFASGGDVIGGMPITVGELGPEKFVPYTNGRIVPHNALAGGGHPVYIDARGSSDPAQTEAAVHRAMRQYMPQAIAMAGAVSRDHAARRPASAGMKK